MPRSTDMLPVLLAHAEELHTNGEKESACQVLFLCAALSKHLKEYDGALQILEQINRLASQNNWNQVAQWAAWGSAAVQSRNGQLLQAVERLDGLQTLLMQSGDWVLADLVEVLSATLTENDTKSIQKDSLVMALLGWGDTPVPDSIPNQDSKMGPQAEGRVFKRVKKWFSRIFPGKLHSIPEREIIQLVGRGLIKMIHGEKQVQPDPLTQVINAQHLILQDNGDQDLENHPGSSAQYTHKVKLDLFAESRDVSGRRQTKVLVYYLGKFKIFINDSPIDEWHSRKGVAVFKYLVAHRAAPVPREVLMEVFWPEVEPDSARNRLNVAVHSLRKAFQSASSLPIVIFNRDAYILNPEVGVWVDFEEFEKHIQSGRQYELAGQTEAATREFEIAISLYQGDFLEEDRYEEWAIMPRESLRLAYLDCLSQLSQIYFTKGLYMAATTLSQRILAYDDCSENAYRLLMRCYARQGQPNLALRLYLSCKANLKTELDISPSPETQSLYESIRNYDPV